MTVSILLVEDDRSIATLVKDYLEIEGFSVHHTISGKEGMEMALNGNFNLVLLDIMLPDLSGFEVCKMIREKSEIPILVVSARKEDVDKIQGLGLGADDYITKPFSPGELVARVKSHLERYYRLTKKQNVSENIIAIREIELNLESRKVFLSKKEIYLTAKEYDILLLLMRNKGKVMSKDDIFNTIWGEDIHGDISTITVHIRKLREKIERNPSEPEYIETIWGIGYRLR